MPEAMRMDFAERYGLDMEYYPIYRDYGTYNGWRVVWVIQGLLPALSGMEVAGYYFGFPNSGDMLHAWKQKDESGNGGLYELSAAYDLGFLTQDDIGNVHKLFSLLYYGGTD
jgi:hypothetical protein